MDRSRKITVLYTDDNLVILDVLQLTLELEPDMEIVGFLTSADNLVGEVASKLPDIILLDVTMPGKSPIAAIKEISAFFTDCRIIVYSGCIDTSVIDRLFEAGVWGYVTKGQTRTVLLRTIRQVANGHHCRLVA
jgi:DNA-binding NarL/FixJ family response regulator